MVTNFYFIVFVACIITTFTCVIRNKNIDSIYLLFDILVTCNCLGRYIIAGANNLQVALLGTKFLYLGGTLTVYLIVITLARLCNIKVSKILRGTLLLYSFVILILVFTIEHNDLYYKSVKLIKGDGYNYLAKEYGPCHFLYPVLMLIYFLIMSFYVIYAFVQRKKVSYRVVTLISVFACGIIVVYILEKLSGSKVSYLSVGYLIAAIYMNNFFERVTMYDVSENIIYTIEKLKEYGYLVFDIRKRFVSSNDYMKELFPEINEWHIDSVVPKSNSYLYEEVIEYLNNWQEGVEPKTIKKNDRYLEMCCRELTYGKKKKIGYQLEFIDRTAENKYIDMMKDYNAMLEEEVEEKITDVLRMKDMLVLGMADLVESRDSNTGGHIKRTSSVVRIFSGKLKEYKENLGINDLFLQRVIKAAPMHDLGKITIDDKILRKNGPFTDEEYNEMKKHTTEGARIVEQILTNVEDDKFLKIAKNVAFYHHEKWNGKGYPKGLAGKDIPLEARIMALADVFDALVSERCYKKPFSYDKAFSIIEESLGEHFDPELGKIFIECRPQLEELYNKEK